MDCGFKTNKGININQIQIREALRLYSKAFLLLVYGYYLQVCYGDDNIDKRMQCSIGTR